MCSSDLGRWRQPVGELVEWAGGDRDSIVVASGERLVGLDARTGAALWEVARDGEGTAFARHEVVGDVVLTLASRALTARETRTGRAVWRVDADHSIATPRDEGTAAGAHAWTRRPVALWPPGGS